MSPSKVVILCQTLRIEEGSTYLKGAHEGRQFDVDLAENSVIGLITGIGRSSVATLDEITCKVVIISDFLLNERADSRAITRGRRSLNLTKVPIRKPSAHIKSLLNSILMIDDRKINVSHLVDYRTLPNDVDVRGVVGPQITIVIEVAGDIRHLDHKIGYEIRNLLSFIACTGSSRDSNLLTLFACGGLGSTKVAVIGSSVIDALCVADPTLHDAVKGAECAFSGPCSLREIVVRGKRNLSKFVKIDSLARGVFGAIELEKVGCFRIISPGAGLKRIGAVIQLRVAIHRTVYTGLID